MNSINSNIGQISKTKDWEFYISTKLNFSYNINFSPDYFGLGKTIGKHSFNFNYSPGIQQKFIFSSGRKAIISDSIQNFYTSLNYFQKYGTAYNFNLNENLGFGFSLNYFEQNFTEEYPTYYSDSSSNQTIWQINEDEISKNFWKGDFGISYGVLENLIFSISTNNLLILKDFDKEDNSSDFLIRTNKYNLKENKSVIIGTNFNPTEKINLKLNYETTSSFIFGTNILFPFTNSNIVFGTTIFHDKYQKPIIAGILSNLSYSNKLYSITISYLKYFGNRNKSKSVNDFNQYQIHNIQHNYFSSDRLFANLNIALSFQKDQFVKFLDVEIIDAIYPTFNENYINQPFAKAKVLNLTSNRISVKPASFIENLNNDKIYSPEASINPNDTLEINYYTVFENDKKDFSKDIISQAEFYLFTSTENFDDNFQKPILIKDKNSWNGEVKNLKYFVERDLEFSKNYTNKILNSYKDLLKQKSEIKDFTSLQILFNSFCKEMIYVSDRRTSTDHVQFPKETISAKGGDCDDLSVCFSSQLESIGIQTAFIDYKPKESIGHVTLLINTKLSPQKSELISINERKYFVRKNIDGIYEIWIPIEVTSLTNFEDAWNLGAEKFYTEAIDNFGLAKSIVEIIDTN
ncbi:MAG: hypothetical protein IPM32_01255 [Ignavibacteriae bacterium]|nr:hypothetical protein [Ignavibacteriota bacterium]